MSDDDAYIEDDLADHPQLQFPPGSDAARRCEKFRRMRIGRQKAIDWDLLRALGEEERARFYVPADSPWDRLFEGAYMPSFRELTVEFLSSFIFRPPLPEDEAHAAEQAAYDAGEEWAPPPEVEFRMFGEQRTMTLARFAVVTGLYWEPETVTPLYTEAIIPPVAEPMLRAWWPLLSDTPYTGTQQRISRVRDPLFRYLHRCIATSITARGDSREWCTMPDMFYFWALLTRQSVQLAHCLATRFASYYRRKETGAVYGGAYITHIARVLGLTPDDRGMQMIPCIRLDSRTAHGMKIVRKFGDVLRFSVEPGVVFEGQPLPEFPMPQPLQAMALDAGQEAPQDPPQDQPQDQPQQHPQHQPQQHEDVEAPHQPQPQPPQRPPHVIREVSLTPETEAVLRSLAETSAAHTRILQEQGRQIGLLVDQGQSQQRLLDRVHDLVMHSIQLEETRIRAAGGTPPPRPPPRDYAADGASTSGT